MAGGQLQPNGYDLELRLVGRLRLLRSDGSEVALTGKKKAQGLLALVGVAKEYRRSRAWLQDKLWSDRAPEQGKQSLRQEIAGLRRAFGDLCDCLITEPGWVGLDPSRVRVKLEPEGDDWEPTGAAPEFAAGLDINDREFEDWIRDQRSSFADRIKTPQVPTTLPAAPILLAGVEAPPTFLEDDAQPSIAVMPFMAVGDPSVAPLVATGLAIDVIGHLSRFKRLDVIAYASCVSLSTGLPVREIGQRLSARYVTQGVLWLDRQRMRLTFDLIDTVTQIVVWSHDWHRSFEDLFDVERDLAVAVAAGAMVEIDHLERSRVRARDPASLDAYALWLRGLDDMLTYDADRSRDALHHFSRAVSLDRHYARALSGISRVHGHLWKFRWADERDVALQESERFALEAVDADAADPRACAALGWVALYRRDHDRSLEAYQRAMDLNPSDADVLSEYGDSLKHSGNADAAVPLFERAIRLNPYDADHYLADLTGTYYYLEDYEGAIRTARRMRNKKNALRMLAASQAMLGLQADASETIALLRQVGPCPFMSPEEWVQMVPDRHEHYTERFLEGMKRAGL